MAERSAERVVRDVSSSRGSAEPVRRRLRRVPGGLTATRAAVSRRGGLTAIASALGLWLAGSLLGTLIGGTAGGAVRFVATVTAVPLMPAFGLPAAGGSTRVLLAVAASAVLWFAVGQWAARTTTRRILAGWREWVSEFAPLAIGVAVGAVASLLLTAIVLGVI